MKVSEGQRIILDFYEKKFSYSTVDCFCFTVSVLEGVHNIKVQYPFTWHGGDNCFKILKNFRAWGVSTYVQFLRKLALENGWSIVRKELLQPWDFVIIGGISLHRGRMEYASGIWDGTRAWSISKAGLVNASRLQVVEAYRVGV